MTFISLSKPRAFVCEFSHVGVISAFSFPSRKISESVIDIRANVAEAPTWERDVGRWYLFLTRALMGSGELRVLMGDGPKAPPPYLQK